MSVAFTREESAETAAEVVLPDRPISPHPNLATASGLEALANAMAEWCAAYNAAQQIEDADERRRAVAVAVAVASREMRYFADRLGTAQVIPPPTGADAVAFGHQVTFKRDDGRRQAFRIVGEDEADPRNGSISYVSPVARALIGKAAGDIVWVGVERRGGKWPDDGTQLFFNDEIESLYSEIPAELKNEYRLPREYADFYSRVEALAKQVGIYS